MLPIYLKKLAENILLLKKVRDNLPPISSRSLSIATTHLDTALLWLNVVENEMKENKERLNQCCSQDTQFNKE